MNENQITLINEDGTEELATILFTHSVDDKNYVVFEIESSGEVSAARYVEDQEGMGQILDIEEDSEWEMLDELLESYYDDLEDLEEELDDEDLDAESEDN